MYARAMLQSNIDDIHHWDFYGEVQRQWWVEHGCILFCKGDWQDTWIVQWPNERDLIMFTLKFI